MAYLLILLCAFLSCTKVTIQGYLSRGNINNVTDSMLANCVVFAFASVLFAYGLRTGVNLSVVAYAVIFGILSVLFQTFYALSLKEGPFATTTMLVNLSMVVPIIFSVIYYNEKVTVTKGIGFILCVAALFLNVKSDGKKVNLKWLIYVSLAFLSTGFVTITQRIFSRTPFGGNKEQFIFFGYLAAFVLSAIIYFVREKAVHERTFRFNKKTVPLAVFVAAFLGVFHFFYTYANSFVDAIVLSPSLCGLATMMQALAGKIIFKEKFTVRKILSICVGIVAIVIISL